MNIPQFFDTLAQVTWLNGIGLLVLSILFGMIITYSNHWLLSLLGLWGLFFCSGLLIAPFVQPHIAFLVWIVGLFSGLILYLSERGKAAPIGINTSSSNTDWIPFLLQIMIGLVFVLVCWVIQFLGLFDLLQGENAVQSYVGLITAILFLLGSLRFFTSEASIFTGYGLLTILIACLLVAPLLLPGKWVIGLWSGVTILLTLVISYFSLSEVKQVGYQ
ncbi:MAG: hypothetical protein AAF633_18325 [Chloroflexota bacterium]